MIRTEWVEIEKTLPHPADAKRDQTKKKIPFKPSLSSPIPSYHLPVMLIITA
jgi:hypothetical protein